MKHSTTLQDVSALNRMTLTPEQAELFSPFGPDLCRMWPLISTSRVPLVDGVNGLAGVHDSLITMVGAGQGLRLESEDNDGAQKEPVVSNTDPIWSNAPTFFPEDDQNLFMSEEALDSVGRWWWSDWVPEADLDFLSKSL